MNPRSEKEFLKAIEKGQKEAERIMDAIILRDIDILPEEHKMVKIPNEEILKIFDTFGKDE